MPHLQFEINKKVSNETKEEFARQIRGAFSNVMDTGTDHIAITLREHDKYNLTIGRANPKDEICLMNLDVRIGRSLEQKRELAIKLMEIVKLNFQVEDKNQYITFTEHKGEDFHLIEKYLEAWKKGDKPLS